MLGIRRRKHMVALWYPKIRMEGSTGWNCCTADVGTTHCSDTVVKNTLWNNGSEYNCDYGCDESCCRLRIYNSWYPAQKAIWDDYNNRYGFSDGNIDNLPYPK